MGENNSSFEAMWIDHDAIESLERMWAEYCRSTSVATTDAVFDAAEVVAGDLDRRSLLRWENEGGLYLVARGYDGTRLEHLIDRDPGLLALSQTTSDMRVLLGSRAHRHLRRTGYRTISARPASISLGFDERVTRIMARAPGSTGKTRWIEPLALDRKTFEVARQARDRGEATRHRRTQRRHGCTGRDRGTRCATRARRCCLVRSRGRAHLRRVVRKAVARPPREVLDRSAAREAIRACGTFLARRGHLHDGVRALAQFPEHTPTISVENGLVVDARLERPIAKNGQIKGRFDMDLLVLPVGHNAPKPPKKAERARPLPTRGVVKPTWIATGKNGGTIMHAHRRIEISTDANPSAFVTQLGKLLGSLDDITARARVGVARTALQRLVDRGSQVIGEAKSQPSSCRRRSAWTPSHGRCIAMTRACSMATRSRSSRSATTFAPICSANRGE
jgi:hypothetical protein